MAAERLFLEPFRHFIVAALTVPMRLIAVAKELVREEVVLFIATKALKISSGIFCVLGRHQASFVAVVAALFLLVEDGLADTAKIDLQRGRK
jgi:hypothetical protein